MTGKSYQRWILAGLFAAWLAPFPAAAFDVVDRQTSHMDSKYMSLGLGLGMTGFARQEGVSGDAGFGIRVSAGHAFNRYLSAEILYQFSMFDWESPDPIDPTSSMKTGAFLHQEVIRVVALYPALLVQPYVTAGIGGYSFSGVNKETALDFGLDFQIPVGAGIRSYVYKNALSFDVEFNYQFLFGENQPADTLALLGLNRVAFDTYSILATFTYHLF